MKIVSFEYRGRTSYGVVDGDNLVDVGAMLGSEFPTLREVLENDALDRVAAAAKAGEATIPLSGITYLIPVTNPGKIICIGVNYANRNEEYKDNAYAASYPSVFMRTPGSFTGHNGHLIRPPESEQLDYEGEIVLVIGKPGRRIPKEQAFEHVAGVTIMNEGTIRDWLRHAKFNVTQGKNFESTGAIGPWMVTLDEIADIEHMAVKTRVNGEVRQDDTTDNIIYDFRYLINYLSTFAKLLPGDIIATGTPTGAGARFDPPKYLKPGDVVEVEVPGVGVLSNDVVDEVV